MSTTTLFVELLVTGFGALLWVVLAVLALMKTLNLSHLVEFMKPAWVTLPIVAVAYVLGIITDRLADKVADGLGEERFLKNWFADRSAYFQAFSEISDHSQGLAAVLHYGRSRLRICRGWAFNCPLILLASLAYIYTHSATIVKPIRASIAVTIVFATATLILWYCWRKIAQSEYKKVKMQSDYLHSKRLKPSGTVPSHSQLQSDRDNASLNSGG